MILGILLLLIVVIVIWSTFSSGTSKPKPPAVPHYTAPTVLGYVYMIRNSKTFKNNNWVKIGMTTREVKDRVKEFNTAVPHNFVVVGDIPCENPYQVEQDIHEALDKYRVHKGKEYFEIDAETLEAELNKIDYLTLELKTNL